MWPKINSTALGNISIAYGHLNSNSFEKLWENCSRKIHDLLIASSLYLVRNIHLYISPPYVLLAYLIRESLTNERLQLQVQT